MKVYRYDDGQEAVSQITGPSIFLAGPTVRGNQPHLTSWRFEAIEEFKRQGFEGSLIVPEFISKTESDKNKAWIPRWEYNGLKKADCIMFWIPRTRELIALTTNMEFGYWQGRDPNKMIYGRPDDAYRMGYLDIMWEDVAEETQSYEGLICNTLVETISDSIAKARFLHSFKKTYYRVAHKDTNQGLWYDAKGKFTGLIHDKFNFCKNKDLQMPYDAEIVGWLSATDSLDELFQWFPKEDIEKLEEYGWYLTVYESSKAKPHQNHLVICEKSSFIKERIPIKTLI